MKLKIFFIGIFLFYGIFTCVLSAQEVNPAFGRLSEDEDHLVGEVCIRDQVVFRINQEDADDPQTRAGEIAGRINTLYSQGTPVSKIEIKLEYKTGEKKDDKTVIGADICWGTETILTITALQARLNKSTPEKLAKEWAENLKKALSVSPVIKVFPSELFLAPGEVAEIKVIGNSSGKLLWNCSSDIISVTESDIPDRLKVKAISPGNATVEFQREVKTLLSVSVSDSPASIIEPNDIALSGSPCPSDFIRDAVVGEVKRSILLRPGSRLSLDPFNINSFPLFPGKEIKLFVPFKIEGGGFKTIESSLPVKLKNEPVSFKEPVLLFMDNSPEKVRDDGILFSQSLSSGSPVRFMYYHINATDTDKWLIVDLVNPYRVAVRVWVASGVGGPNSQEAFVGHVATARFVRNCQNSAGQFFTIPPESRISIYTQKMPPNQILTGICHLQFPTPSYLSLVVRAQSDPYEEPAENLLPPDADSTHCRGIYSNPKILINETYQVGDSEKSIYIGKSPFLIDQETGGELYGNYGVFYDMTVKLINNTSQISEVGFYFTSQGGIAQGTFLIDGTLVETPVVRSSEHVSLSTFLLKPKEERTINLQTIPQGGSHYPVRVLIKS